MENTSSPVDLDIVNDILRLPYRQRFAILLNEFGTGLAGRGEELNEVIHRANPALRETDEVLAILADQNRTLARLARDSDQALGPLAREREVFADLIVQANETGQASAERRGDLRRGINLLPEFLRELRPLMADLEGFADQGTPLLRDLEPPRRARASDQGTGHALGRRRESFPSLGDALERGRPALLRARPLIHDLGRLGREAAPASRTSTSSRRASTRPAASSASTTSSTTWPCPRTASTRRALPARRAGHQHLLDLRAPARRRLPSHVLDPVAVARVPTARSA